MTNKTHSKRMHWPRFYRYQVANPKSPVGFCWNRYGEIGKDHVTIGALIVVGHWAYCVKWAEAIWIPRWSA